MLIKLTKKLTLLQFQINCLKKRHKMDINFSEIKVKHFFQNSFFQKKMKKRKNPYNYIKYYCRLQLNSTKYLKCILQIHIQMKRNFSLNEEASSVYYSGKQISLVRIVILSTNISKTTFKSRRIPLRLYNEPPNILFILR